VGEFDATTAYVKGAPALAAAVVAPLITGAGTYSGNGAPAAPIAKVRTDVLEPFEFVTVIGTNEVPALVGVPVMAPFALERASPDGNCAEEKLPSEPEYVSTKLNGVLTVPAANSGLFVITGRSAPGPTVIVKVAMPVPAELVAPIIRFVVPPTLGVPLMIPVAGVIVRPGGKGLAK
jgi:hypothetical protein